MQSCVSEIGFDTMQAKLLQVGEVPRNSGATRPSAIFKVFLSLVFDGASMLIKGKTGVPKTHQITRDNAEVCKA